MPSSDIQDILNQATVSNVQAGQGALEKMEKTAGAGGVNTSGMKKELGAEREAAGKIAGVELPKAPDINTNLAAPPQAKPVDPFDVFKQVGPAMLVLGSLAARKNNTAAITAAAAMMKSYQEGKKEEFEQQRQTWLDETQKTIDEAKLKADDFKMRAEAAGNNLDKFMAEYTVHAKIFGNEADLAAVQAGNAKLPFEQQKSLLEGITKLQDVVDKAKKNMAGVTLSDESLDRMSEQYISGDKSVLQNIGRGTQGAANIAALHNAVSQKLKERGMSGSDQANADAEFKGREAEERTIGTQEANVRMAATEARKIGGVLRQVSETVPRSDIIPIGDGEVSIKKSAGNIPAAQLEAAVNTYINVYARAINPKGVARIGDKEHAREVLMAGMGKGQMAGVLDILDKEIDAALASPGAVREGLRGGAPQREEKTIDGQKYYKEGGKWYHAE